MRRSTASNIQRAKAPLVLTCGIAVATVGALSAFVLACEKLLARFEGLQRGVHSIPGLESVSNRVTAFGLAACLTFIGISAFIPKWFERRRAAGLQKSLDEVKLLLEKVENARLFRLEPIPAPKSIDDPIAFERPDSRHLEILEWIQNSRLPLLYVTGHSGSGKSSLMQAYVVPMLKRPGVATAKNKDFRKAAIIVRAFGDIAQTLRDALGVSGVVWRSPPDLNNLNARQILEKAGARCSENHGRLVMVLDQFEEVLIDAGDPAQANVAAIALVKSLVKEPIEGICCVLVARAEYGEAFASLGLPPREDGKTWQDVPAFTLSDGAKFLAARLPGEKSLESDGRAIRLAREAEALVDLPGRVTPIALNMIGLMYVEDPILGAGLAKPGIASAEGVLPAYVRGRIQSGDLREVGPALLKHMITSDGRRTHPIAAAVLAGAEELKVQTVESALLTLQRYGLVRHIGEQWEVAHDFLAPLLRVVLVQIHGSILRRLKPWLPLPVAAAIGLALACLWIAGQSRVTAKMSGQIADQIKLQNERDQLAADQKSFDERATIDWSTHSIQFFNAPTNASLRHLQRLGGKWTVNLQLPGNLARYQVNAFDSLSNVEHVWLVPLDNERDRDEWLHELTLADGCLNLTVLSFESTTIGFTTPTDVGMKELARPDSGLGKLERLYLGDAPVTMAGIKELARPDTGLKSLTYLVFACNDCTSADLREISGSNTGLKSLTGLRSMAGLKTNDIEELTRPETGLKSLTILGDIRRITDEGLRQLSKPNTGLPNLVTLDLSSTDITDAGCKILMR
ncbi:MAG TPA: hypothetical protein VH370_04555, partial [Humisphaera sp.]|nr:hypothetical protein [Humisphaera sp.]